jgi:hypothetical protein
MKAMEGSMRMMSWSRYHYRPWSPLRIKRRHRRAKSRPTRQDQNGSPENPLPSSADGGRGSYFEFITRLFRT